jgi:hypothetical protein
MVKIDKGITKDSLVACVLELKIAQVIDED